MKLDESRSNLDESWSRAAALPQAAAGFRRRYGRLRCALVIQLPRRA